MTVRVAFGLASALIVLGWHASPALAVEVGSTFQTVAPTGADIADWDVGWGSAGVTGWNYVGQINGASATYLGNGWVLTAGHVGAGTFDLNGNSYAQVAGTTHSFDTADLTLFQINTTATNDQLLLNLPTLSLSTTPPVAFNGTSGSPVVMIGYGGGNESWGLNTVTQINETVDLPGTPYATTDFLTLSSSTVNGHTVTNTALLVGGDSGGGDFIRNPVTGAWELAGINEAVGTAGQGQTLSAFVQLDDYAPQIDAIINPVPLPAAAWLLLSGCGALGLTLRRRPA